MTISNTASTWYVYILQCADGTLYTGATTDLESRVITHNLGQGAKYTRSRLPVKLVYQETCGSHSLALQRELAIKRLSRLAKIKLFSFSYKSLT